MPEQKVIQKKIKINRKDVQMIKCSNSECDSNLFTQIFELGMLSGIISATGQNQIVSFAKMVCVKCGHEAIPEPIIK